MQSREDKRAIAVIIGLFALQVFLISPIGEFPLNDDWTPTLSIAAAAHGEWYYPPWLSTFSLVPIGYGIAITKLFGFGFSALRISNLVFSLGSLIVLYLFLRQRELSARSSFAATLLLWANPIFFNLSYTFMGDIPALFFTLAALHCFDRGFRERRGRLVAFGILATALGFFTRQIPVVLLGAAALAAVQTRFFSWKRSLLIFGGSLAALGAATWLLFHAGIAPGTVGSRLLPSGWSYTNIITSNATHLALLATLALAPVVVAVFVKHLDWLTEKKFLALLAVSLGLAALAAHNGIIFGHLGNIITEYGLGPSKTLMQGSLQPIRGPRLFFTLHYLLAATFAGLVWIIAKTRVRPPLLLTSYAVLYLLLILPIQTFDRYNLLLMPVLCFVAAKIFDAIEWSKSIFAITLAVLAILSTVGTHDYLAWNRARWKLGNELLAKNVPAQDIEGGYEWDGWQLYRRAPLGAFTPKWAPWYVKELVPGHLMEYIIAFTPLGGYEVIAKKETGAFAPNLRTIYVNQTFPKPKPPRK